MASEEHDVVLSLCAGGSLMNGGIIFSHDSKFFMCCSGWTVRIHHTDNGLCAQILEGHRDLVTGLALNPANKLQLFSCGLDGIVNRWVYNEGVLLKTYTFGMPLHALVSPDPSGLAVFAIARRPQAANCSLLRLPLPKSGVPTEGAGVKMDVMLPVVDADHRKVSHGCQGQYIAAVHGSEMWVYSTQRKTSRKLTTEARNPFTCVACHPSEACLATGHENGQITFWWNFSQKEQTVVSTSHWHSLPVQCLAFTPEGSCLLSGGHECVLVRWHMNAEQKDFLPRLGAPLHSITSSPDGATFITAHTDNVLQAISSSFSILHAVRGLARAHLGSSSSSSSLLSSPSSSPALRDPVPVGLLWDPRSKALVTNGRPGHLQFYCMESDAQLYNLDIVGQNYVSPDSLQQATAVTEVMQTAFDPSGDWLATFQQWEDGVFTPEYCLKFWRFNRKQQNYQLNTTVETPHYKTLRCLRFRPQETSSPRSSQSPLMVSTGEDGFFKLWSLASVTHHGKSVQQWMCEWVGHYRNKPAGLARFSPDGLTMAVTFDMVLTLWDPESNVMSDKIVLDEDILGVEFAGGSDEQFIVVSTRSHLTVLHLSTLTVHTQMALPGALLASDGDLMCAVTSQQDLYVFRPGQEQPLLHKRNATSNPVIAAVFLPYSEEESEGGGEGEGALNWQSKSRLYLMDSQQMLFTPTLGDTRPHNPPSRLQIPMRQVLPQTPFQALLSSQHHQLGEKREEGGVSLTPAASHHHTVHPLADFNVMDMHISNFGSFSQRAQSLLEAMMLHRKGNAEQEMETDS